MALLSLLALAPRAKAADGEHCKLLLATSLDMEADRLGGPTVPVSVDGSDETMLVDTGGIYSMITNNTASDLHLRKDMIDPGQFYMVTGRTIARVATAQLFKIGRLQLQRYTFLTLPDDEAPQGLAGLIAPDVLSRFDAEFDFAGGKLNLFSQDHCEGNVVYWTQDDYAAMPFRLDESKQITLDAKLDGKDVTVLIDTGSTRSIMTLRRARELFGVREDNVDLKLIPNERIKDEPLYSYPLKSLDLNGLAVRNPDIALYNSHLQDTGGPDIILGMTVLGKLHLYIAYKEKVLYLTPAGPRPPSKP